MSKVHRFEAVDYSLLSLRNTCQCLMDKTNKKLDNSSHFSPYQVDNNITSAFGMIRTFVRVCMYARVQRCFRHFHDQFDQPYISNWLGRYNVMEIVQRPRHEGTNVDRSKILATYFKCRTDCPRYDKLLKLIAAKNVNWKIIFITWQPVLNKCNYFHSMRIQHLSKTKPGSSLNKKYECKVGNHLND